VNTSQAGTTEAIVQILAAKGDERPPFAEVVSLLRTSGADDATIKATIWRLRSEGRIELTQDWKLKLRRAEAVRRAA
jgi:hypothetical protein